MKAQYRALRELVGASHAIVAETLGVAERSVKRWEDPRYGDPPQHALDYLASLKEKQDRAVALAVEQAERSESGRIKLTYYRTQSQFIDHACAEKNLCDKELFALSGGFHVANATARAAAIALEIRGFTVEFAYPESARTSYYTSSYGPKYTIEDRGGEFHIVDEFGGGVYQCDRDDNYAFRRIRTIEEARELCEADAAQRPVREDLLREIAERLDAEMLPSIEVTGTIGPWEPLSPELVAAYNAALFVEYNAAGIDYIIERHTNSDGSEHDEILVKRNDGQYR